MELIQHTTAFELQAKTAVAMGKFDGIHRGHRRLLEEILKQKERGMKACVFTFDPPPSVLFGAGEERLLTTPEEKRRILEQLGVDILIEYPLNRETAAVDPECFVREFLHDRMHAGLIAAGDDLSFGKKGAGNAALLDSLRDKYHFEVKIISKVCMDGASISSTRIRSLVEAGKMEEVQRLSGAAYSCYGQVIQGNHIGHTLGFPTVNLLPPENKLLPPKGVYFTKVHLGGKSYDGVTNVGCKPTISSHEKLGVETYLYDFAEDVYGKDISVDFLHYRRPEKRFAGLEELREQLTRDIAEGKAFFAKQVK